MISEILLFHIKLKILNRFVTIDLHTIIGELTWN